MTLTDELYLPTRLVYEIYDVKQLHAWLKKTSCMEWHPVKNGWTWNYTGAAKNLDFPSAYDKIPKERQPVVLATCYLVNDQSFHVYARCGLRAAKFLVFFDKQVSRSIAIGKFIDEYNLITSVGAGASLPMPEDNFKDESKIEFLDFVGLHDSSDTPVKKQALSDLYANMTQATLRPLERHRLDVFYEDGYKHMEQELKFREIMARLQAKSDSPIRPAEVISSILSSNNQVQTSNQVVKKLMPTSKRIGRNDPCPCGSGRKYKNCCLPSYDRDETNQVKPS